MYERILSYLRLDVWSKRAISLDKMEVIVNSLLLASKRMTTINIRHIVT